MSKGDSILVSLRYGPPTVEMKATRDGRKVRTRKANGYVLLEELTKSNKVVRTTKLAPDAVIAIEEHRKGDRS